MSKSMAGILIGFVVLLFSAPSARTAESILAVMFENGKVPPDSSDGSLTIPLFCSGNVECGSVRYSDLVVNRADSEKFDAVATVKVCRGVTEAASCVTARNAHFQGDALPVARPDGVLYAESMVEHDPIQCSDVTGEFFVPGCTGILKLDYRCLTLADPETGLALQSLASSYVISEIP